MSRPLTFQSEGARLSGIFAGPETEPKHAAVVLVHGWSGYRIGPHRMLLRTARCLNRAGYATLHFDLRGRGDSEGDYATTDLDMMIRDTMEAIRAAQRESTCDKVWLLGICSGANVAIGAATLSPGVCGVVAWSALPYQKHVTHEQQSARRQANLMEYVRKAFRLQTWKKVIAGRVNYRLVRSALRGSDAVRSGDRNLKESARDIMSDLKSYRGRILFVHGSKDPEGMVGRQHFMEFHEHHGLEARFHLVEGANHSYYSLAWESAIVEASLAFMEER